MTRATPPRLWLLLFALLFAGAAPAEEGAPVGSTETESPEETESSPTLADLLQGQDGVRIQTMCTHCNSANIQVGGLSQDHAPVYRNGYPVIGGLATSILLNILPPDAVAETKVDKGPGSAAAASSAAGGTMRLTESTPLEVPLCEVILEGGSYDSVDLAARVAGPIRPWLSGMVTASTESVDVVDDDGDGWNDVAAVERTFAEGQLNFEIGRSHDLDVGVSWIDEEDEFGRGKWDNLAWDWQNPDAFLGWVREDTSFDRIEYRGGWSWSLGKGREIELKLLDATRNQAVLAQETRESEFLPELTEIHERFVIREDNSWGGLTYRHPVGMRWLLSAGVEAERDRLHVESYAIFSDEPEPGTDRLKHSSAYAEFEWAVSHKWELQAGIRYTDATWKSTRTDPNPLIDELLTESQSKDRALPRFSLKFKPADAWTLRLLAGATLRVPESVMSEVCCGQRYQRNASTLAETGETWGFEGIYQPSPDLRTNLYIARTYLDDYIMRVPGWSDAYIQTYALANVSEARADTAEIAVRWSPTWFVTFDASLGWLSFKSREVERVTMEIDQMSGPVPAYLLVDRIPYLPVRTASISASLSLPRGGSITLGGAYTGEMLIHWFDPDNPQELPPGFPIFLNNSLQEEPRWTDDFLLVNMSAEVPIRHGFNLLAAVNNIGDYIQNDLGDPATDYNWGPLSGISWRVGLKYHFD